MKAVIQAKSAYTQAGSPITRTGTSKKVDMETNGWRAPEYDLIRLTREIEQQFSVLQGGPINQAAFYLDSHAAADWCSISQQSLYDSTFHPPTGWADKISAIIFHHLKNSSFAKDKLDIVGLGVGEGHREISLSRSMLQTYPLERLRCFLLDISPCLVMKAHSDFMEALGRRSNVESNWLVGDIHNLPRYSSLFYDPADANVLRVCTLFSVLDNVRHERNFIEQSLRAFKSGDLLIIDPSLLFGPLEQPELIKKEDPSFGSLSGLDWLEGVIRRNRPQTQEIEFSFQLKFGLSTFPKAYTIEIFATVDRQAKFSIFQKHRYSADEFIKFFMELGWRPLDGMLFGPNNTQMIYVFAKK